MKSKLLLILFAFLLISCNNNDENNTRIYIEGNVITTLPLEKIAISIKSGDRIIAETHPQPNTYFILSGPSLETENALIFNEKIKKFSTDKIGLQLSKDSMSIKIPSSISYLKFNSIELTK